MYRAARWMRRRGDGVGFLTCGLLGQQHSARSAEIRGERRKPAASTKLEHTTPADPRQHPPTATVLAVVRGGSLRNDVAEDQRG